MNRRIGFYYLVLCTVLLVTVAACRSTSSDQVGDIPDFAQTELDGHRGQIVVLNFWAGWCAPCRSEMPALQSLYEEYQDKGLVVLGVNVSDTGAEVARFAASRHLTFPMFTDPDQQFMKAYNVRSLPTTFFVNADGAVVARHVGAMTQSSLRDEVEPLLR